MKYYCNLVIFYNDGKKDKTATYTYEENENEAIAAFHSEMGKAMKDVTVKHCLCMAYNSEGGIYCNESYTAPEVEVAE